ncbi:MAG TPA: hypothetical protein PLN78_07275, partial [Pseudomonadales bacterium]|nr:hypothetical protein [Pseudomonadales bacterium]
MARLILLLLCALSLAPLHAANDPFTALAATLGVKRAEAAPRKKLEIPEAALPAAAEALSNQALSFDYSVNLNSNVFG